MIEELKELMLQSQAVKAMGNFEAYTADNGDIVAVFPITIEHTNVHGIVHGGVFITMLDTVMGYASFADKGKEAKIVTVNFTTSFISNCRPGETVKILGRVISSSKKIVVAQGEVITEEGKLLVTAQGTFLVLD